MIGKKREEIRKRIRRDQIEEHFKTIREKLIIARRNEPQIQADQVIFFRKEVKRCFQEMAEIIQTKNYQSLNPYFSSLFEKVHHHSLMSYLILCNSSQFCLCIELAIKNAIEARSKLQPGQNDLRLISQLLALLGDMTYYQFQIDDFKNLLNSFWDIYRENVDDFQGADQLKLEQLSLRVVYKMLQTQNQNVFKSLKEIGLGARLVYYIKSNQSLICKQILSKIVQVYLYEQQCHYKRSEVCKVGDVYIEGIQNSEKQFLCLFCISLLKERVGGVELSCLRSLTMMMKKYEFLACSIQIPILKDIILYLMHFHDRNVKVKAFEFLSQITFAEKEIDISELLEDMTIIDSLHLQLQKEIKISDKLTKEIMQIADMILSNLVFTTTRTKKQLAVHPIWTFIYQNIQPDSPSLALAPSFEYLFEIVGKYVPEGLIISYIQSIGSLNLNEVDGSIRQKIYQTIRRLFQNSKDFYQQHIQQSIKFHLHNNNLYYIVDQMILEEETL